ncbi:MAG: GAF domain-containing protein [Sphingomonadales bacterium]|jgi:GAF domain-containing protein
MSPTKAEIYETVSKEILAVIDGEPNITARMASVACLLSQAFETYFWTGFYVVDPDKTDELVVGPYQGTLGCLRIPFGQGVCGVAAQSRETQLVADVHAFSGHIACDSRSNSEIVVPVFNQNEQLIAVLDVDSEDFNSFDEVDRQALEKLMKDVFADG